MVVVVAHEILQVDQALRVVDKAVVIMEDPLLEQLIVVGAVEAVDLVKVAHRVGLVLLLLDTLEHNVVRGVLLHQ